MREFILKFKIKTPDGSKEYFHPHFGSEQDAQDAARRLSSIYYTDVEIFSWAGKSVVDEVPAQTSIVYRLQDAF